MKEIKDIISKLTPEERKLHQELIKECIEREINVDGYIKNTKKNFIKLNEISNRIINDFDTITKECQKINLASQKTDGRVH